MKSPQLLKGVIEGAILKIISQKSTYGYEIYQILMQYGFNDFSEGSLYPLLVRLETKQYIKSEKKESPLGPDRKYYYLTSLGEEQLANFETSWLSLVRSMKALWGGLNNECI
ncbi:PadR family transcriptional regulator [Candidatus Contubernalis alkaliaceticus]|uniref:PadR family transcriptional regulator n=1 Tax=Candidatus Contubernalis alkaliaceticus TaxID=338645 RepID=UPI001F4C2EE2|nr:PadR family transcriptional regulator [Candidatus Contubernalis alkalaceticus]UNC93232.1 PadR family transcriptional regulator [Candidatus Contubernalis alkalaceticus]